MRKIGFLTTFVVILVAVFGARLGVKSVPDLQRYLRIRAM